MKHPSCEHFLKVREEFPALADPSRIYLDSAATTHKPLCVIRALTDFYESAYATVHRAVYKQSLHATDLYHQVRAKVARYIHAASPSEVVITRGATDGINILAESFRSLLTPTSRILVSEMEHHSNLIPWQLAAQATGASLEPIPITQEGALDLDALRQLLSEGHVAIVAVTHCSNLLGTVNPIHEIASMAHDGGAYCCVDGAQAAAHLPVDMHRLGCDSYVFSAHKMYGPTGVGILWARETLLDRLPPARGGGDMIDTVTFSSSTWAELPCKFEPGTPPIAEAIAFGAALDFLHALSIPAIFEYEQALSSYLTQALLSIPSLQCVGTALPRGALQTFYIPGVHPLDIAALLDLEHIAVRSGNLCCQPLLQRLSLPAVTRASVALYNTFEEIDRFVAALDKVVKKLR